MHSDRLQRQIDRLLDEAEAAVDHADWAAVLDRVERLLVIDPENPDALAYRAVAERGLQRAGSSRGPEEPRGARPSASVAAAPVSFANGRYAVKRFLGEGGKKKVYLAHDSLLDRDVAFALIKTEGLDEVGRERVRREAQAMGRLGAHPHIVSVFDLGEHADQPYMVTELMNGGDVEGLLEHAEHHRLPLEQALRIADEVCRGLEFAHSHHLVHRDLKPGNVWLTAEGTAKIGDFGLAVAIDKTRLTQAGLMVGTVSYMPPEQAMGGEVTARSDLYSLGAMLYELVCGRPPFVGDESVAIISQHLNTPPVAPSWHVADLPPGLEALLLRLLEKDPSKRPASAAEVRATLTGIALTPRPPLPILGEGEQKPDASPLSQDWERGVGGVRAENPLYRRTFVGREPELRQLQAAFDATLSGQGSLIMVVGEPGIGKTALCEQLATYVAIRGGRTLVGHCYEEGSLSLPYLAFVEAMRSYVLTREPAGLAQDLGSGADEVARLVSEVRDRVPVEVRPGSDREEDRWRLYQAVTEFLRTASQAQALVIVLEDLHWADRGTLDLLVHLARNLEGARLLLVGTYRDVDVDRSHPLSGTLAELRRIASFARLPLRGLTADEVQRMLSASAGQQVSWGLAEAVHRQTEGNPLFIQEVLRYLVEEGLLTRDAVAGRWTRAGPTPLELSIPEGLREVIGKRLSHLSEECNRLLGIAAVIGREFALDTLRAVAAIGEDEVLAPLEEALRVGVLEEHTRPGMIRYRFAHAFFRQTLYEEMIAPRRLRMHQQVARTLERQYASRLEEHAAELADHFAQSTDAEDLTKAVAYGEMAARRALAVFAYGEAARLLEQAVQVHELVGAEDRARHCDLLVAQGHALRLAGQPERAFTAIAPPAFVLAEDIGDRERAFQAAAMAVRALQAYGGAGIASAAVQRLWAERVWENAGESGAPRIEALIARATVQMGAGQLRAAGELRWQALEMARGLPDPEAQFRAVQPILGNPKTPRQQIQALQLAREYRNWSRIGVADGDLNLWHAGAILLEGGDRRGAEELWHELEEVAQRTRLPRAVSDTHRSPIVRHTLDGELEAATAAADEFRAAAAAEGAPVRGHVQSTNTVYRALLYLGRAADALVLLSPANELASGEPEGIRHYGVGPTLLCRALIGERAAALEGLERALRHLDPEETLVPNLVTLLETAVLLRASDAVPTLMPALEPLVDMLLWQFGPICIARCLGDGAALLGDRSAARTYYDHALEVAGRVAHRPELAITRLSLAELLLDEAVSTQQSAVSTKEGEGKLRADKLTAEGLALLDFAIEEFRTMQMQPYLERALRHKGLLHA